MKATILGVLGAIGSFIAGLFGGWDASIITLLIVMGIDFITGLICAGIFHKSKKTENGALESRAGWKGLIRKGVTLLIIIVATRLDMQLGVNYIRDCVCIAFISNEVLSIIENAGLMGIPIPKIISKAIEVLKYKSEEPIKDLESVMNDSEPKETNSEPIESVSEPKEDK